MTFYELLLFVHVFAVAVWVGGGVALEVFGTRARRSANPAEMGVFAGQAEFLGKFVLTGAALVVLVGGFGLVGEGDWSMGEPFVSAGLGIFFISFVTGTFFLGPQTQSLREVIAAEGPESPAVIQRTTRILLVARIDLLLLIAAVFLMTTKLGT